MKPYLLKKSLLYRDLTRPFALHNMKASFVLAAQHRLQTYYVPVTQVLTVSKRKLV